MLHSLHFNEMLHGYLCNNMEIFIYYLYEMANDYKLVLTCLLHRNTYFILPLTVFRPNLFDKVKLQIILKIKLL